MDPQTSNYKGTSLYFVSALILGAVTKALLKKGGDEIKKECEKQSMYQ